MTNTYVVPRIVAHGRLGEDVGRAGRVDRLELAARSRPAGPVVPSSAFRFSSASTPDLPPWTARSPGSSAGEVRPEIGRPGSDAAGRPASSCGAASAFGESSSTLSHQLVRPLNVVRRARHAVAGGDEDVAVGLARPPRRAPRSRSRCRGQLLGSHQLVLIGAQRVEDRLDPPGRALDLDDVPLVGRDVAVVAVGDDDQRRAVDARRRGELLVRRQSASPWRASRRCGPRARSRARACGPGRRGS